MAADSLACSRAVWMLVVSLGIRALGGCGEEPVHAEPRGDAGAEAPNADAASSDDAQKSDDFCLTRPALPFCEDFDAAALPGAFASMTGAEAMRVESVDSSSKPAALRIAADPAAGASLDARLISAQLAPGKKLRSMVFVRAPVRPLGSDDAPLRLTSFQFTTTAGSYRYSFATSGTGEWFGEELFEPHGGGAVVSKRFPSSLALPSDVWTPIRLEVDSPSAGAPTTFSVRVGAELALGPVAIVPSGTELGPTFSLGLDGATPAQPWAVRFDNVTFHFE